MFCYQCEQTSNGGGCTLMGVCGKEPEVAAMQDLLVHALKGLSQYAHRLRGVAQAEPAADLAVVEGLFTTVTNVNFDGATIEARLRAVVALRDALRGRWEAAGGAPLPADSPAVWEPAADTAGLLAQAEDLGIQARADELGDDLVGLQELLTYGLKGMAAYADHALILGQEDDAVYAFIHEALDFLTVPEPGVDELLAMNLRCGEVNLKVLELLDAANTGAYGHPVPTEVRTTPVAGKCILVSGHDLKDLEVLLEQTAGMGINIFTHGEMLPAHGYPELHKHPHLAGHYGHAWQLQAGEFGMFPGAILMTTNCIQEPMPSYEHRIFTSGLVEWPGVQHIADQNFAPVIEAALAEPGFATTAEDTRPLTVGFGHHTVLGVAPVVIDAVKSGALKRFVLIGGCDGAKPGRNYYNDLAKRLPEDSVILTLGCGKFRINAHDYGTLGGLPRLLDMGQCNDAYSAIKVAVALAEAFECGVNDLPLSLVLSWYEQKAVCILLSLLHLGIRDIRVGPSLPAFVTPAVLNVLVDKFALKPIGDVTADLEAICA